MADFMEKPRSSYRIGAFFIINYRSGTTMLILQEASLAYLDLPALGFNIYSDLVCMDPLLAHQYSQPVLVRVL